MLYLAGYYVYLVGCYEYTKYNIPQKKSEKHTETVNQPKIEGKLEETREFLRCSMYATGT
jgi:hypothetical protein